ncbi:hypothetical protein QMM42_18085, partial [Leptospira santarosai]|nr:hypothetical protein [Leptospira santarosai]
MSNFEIFELIMGYTIVTTLAVWALLAIPALIIASFIWKSRFSLFATGFVQVFLVAINTYLISKEKYIAVFFVGGLIS